MRRLDPWLLLATLVIGVCAYLAQTSTAQALASPGYANRQLVWLALGGAIVLLFAFADYRVLARFSPLFYVVSVAVLLFLLVASPLRAGTHSWFVIGKFTVQPSEFARIATILAVAALAGEHSKETLSRGLVLRLAGIIALPVVLIVAQPDLGVALTYAPVLLAALWIGGLPWKVWVGLVVGGLLVVIAAWLWLLKPYQQERILTFVDAERAPYGAGYQQRQSKIAVGSGEVTGKGLRSGTQSQLRFLPAQHTDFIFAVWAEETGFFGASILVSAYGLLVARLLFVASQARDRTGALVAGCIGAVLATQVIVNVAMVTGLAPTTGITLPFMSYGGSSILATAIALGLVQSVWRLRFANV